MQIPSDFLREAWRLFGRLRRPGPPAVLSHVLATFDLHGITLAVTDGEHWLETFRAAAPEPGGRCELLIPARAMAAACRSDRGGSVGLTPGGTFSRRELRVDVRCGGVMHRSVHPAAAAEAFPAAPRVAGTPVLMPARTLETLSLAAVFAGRGARRPFPGGVGFTPADGGRLLASDGRRFASLPARVPSSAFILPLAAVRVLADPGFRGFENEITLADGGAGPHALFRCWDQLLVARLQSGAFPQPRLPSDGESGGRIGFDPGRRQMLRQWLLGLPDRLTPVRLACAAPGRLALAQCRGDATTATLELPVELHGRPAVVEFPPLALADALAIGSSLAPGDGRGPAICRDPGGGFCLLPPSPRRPGRSAAA